MKRVVVTGLGAITPIGNDLHTFWTNCLNGVIGARAITRFDATNFKTKFACEIKEFKSEIYLNMHEVKRSGLFI